MAYDIEAILSQSQLELKIKDGAGHSFTVLPIDPDSITVNDISYSDVVVPHHRGGIWAVVNEGKVREAKSNTISGRIMDVGNDDVGVLSLRRILTKLKKGRLDEIDNTDVWVSTNPLPGGGRDMLDFILTGVDSNNATHTINYGACWISSFDMNAVDGGFTFSITILGCEENTFSKEE